MVTKGKLPQTPSAKKVLEYAIDEARRLNHNYMGSEHLLLGLLREEAGVAAQVLVNLGLRLEVVRHGILSLLGTSTAPATPMPSAPAEFLDLPGEVARALTELQAQIARLNFQKEEAVAEQEFYRAALLRDQADKLKKEAQALRRDWYTRYIIDPSWLTGSGGKIATLANDIATSGRWEDLPALGADLKAAGCADAEILVHCRQPGPHTDHCWVVDLLLRSQARTTDGTDEHG
jgi:ATP-dependent Clp protease ATP-binding subunit ClpA